MLPGFDTLILFLLVLARISAFLVAAPFFSLQNFPVMLKAALALGMAALLVPAVPSPEGNFAGALDFSLALAREVGVGLALGFICTLLFSALSVGGQLIDIKIGFFMSQIFDPTAGGQSTIISRFLFLLGMAFFLSVNAHHEIIAILAKSFEAVPPLGAAVSGKFALVLIRAFADMMVLAVKITAPIMAVALVVDVSLGLVGRTAPQLNIFILGFPIKIMAGIITLSTLVPVLGSIFNHIFQLMERDMLLLLREFFHGDIIFN